MKVKNLKSKKYCDKIIDNERNTKNVLKIEVKNHRLL